MQSSQPKYITSMDQIHDPETGQLLYDRGQAVPYADAVKYGLGEGTPDNTSDDKPASIPPRNLRKALNRLKQKGRNTAIQPSEDR